MRVHKDLIKKGKRTNGYAIRIGDRVPKHSANLAYVHSKPVTPENNLILEDVSGFIRENGLSNFAQQDFIVYPNKEYTLETESGQSLFPTDSFHVTDEFTIKKNRQDQPHPVFYRAELTGKFDIRNSLVLPYVSGYSTEIESSATLFEETDPDKRSELLYFSNNIRIERNGGSLLADERYKILLVRENQYIYRIYIFTNFQSGADVTYKVTYPNYNEEKRDSYLKEEVLNSYPFFEHVTNERFSQIVEEMQQNPTLYKHLKVYTTVKEEAGFKVFATSDIMIADYPTRPPQFFKHRMVAKLQTRLSEINTGKINIGFFHIQNAVNVQNLRSVGKVINENEMIPEYLTLYNSISENTSLEKKDITYWHIDLLTPQEQLNNFDMIVITGYGKENMSSYQRVLKSYLENGGVIWIDNAGSDEQALDFCVEEKNTFVVDIRFSETEEDKNKTLVEDSAYTNRLYNLSDAISSIGYDGVNPKIDTDEIDTWEVLVSYKNGNPSIMKKTFYEKGTLIVSNCGIFRNAYHHNIESIQFILNAFIHHTEEKWFLTPWLNDFVYNRENLFKQEYKDENGDIYIDERNEYNPSQIVAKKILHPMARSYVRNFVKPWFYQRNVVGEYYHKILNSNLVSIVNNGFESGSNNGKMEWDKSVEQAIYGWSTVYTAGDTPFFSYSDSFTSRGKGQITIRANKTEETGSYAFWKSNPIYLTKDSYTLTAWIKCSDVKGINTDGAKVGIFTENGEKLAESEAIKGSSDWREITFSFDIKDNQNIVIRLGFCDGNGVGSISFDKVEMNTLGVVKSSTIINGLHPVYAFSTKPNAATIDIAAEGFENANITRIQPEVPFTYTIRSFIYKNVYGTLEKKYGPQASYNGRVKKGDGLVSLGFLHFLLPEFPGGAEWSDKNKIYYEISLGDTSEEGNKLVNLKMIDKRTGSEWYSGDTLIIGYKDLYYGVDRPSYVLHVETNYETIRATKRHFALHLVDNNRITCELPRTKDAKENWYIKFRNGQFSKEELGYKELSEIYKNHPNTYNKLSERTIRKENYSVKEYQDQVFNPSAGIMTVENEASYINPNTIRVPHNNLLIRKGTVKMEELVSEGIVYSYNMIKHGYDSFESFIPGQAVGRVTTEGTIAEISNEHAYLGETSMKVESSGGLMEVWLDVEAGHNKREGIPVVGGQDYFYTFYVFNPFDDPVDVDGIIEFENGSLIGTPKVSVQQSDGWKRIELYVIAPSGSRSASVGLRIYGSGPVYFDCFQLEDAI